MYREDSYLRLVYRNTGTNEGRKRLRAFAKARGIPRRRRDMNRRRAGSKLSRNAKRSANWTKLGQNVRPLFRLAIPLLESLAHHAELRLEYSLKAEADHLEVRLHH